MAFLTAISGSSFGKRFDVEKPETVLGRHPDCDVTIEVGAVSRQHARIHRNGETFLLEDLKSRNGTFLNGHPISARTQLQEGDLIRICDVEYSFHAEPDKGLMTATSSAMGDGSSFGVMMVDDEGQGEASRAVSSKLDIRGSRHGSQLNTSSEARLDAVLQIAQNLGRALKIEDVLPKVLDTLFKIFLQADRAFIVLKEGDELIPRWIKTRQEEQTDAFRISRTVMREVMESREAIISLDATSDERFEMANSISDFRIRSMIVAPLLDSDGHPLGAIQIDTLDTKRHFEDKDLEILAGVATQAGVAIENAQLHEQLVNQHRVSHDLDLARNVQKAFVPSQSPSLPGYSFFQYYRPADQIGGDYFDYIELSDGRMAIITADVSGHGIAAAMLMAKLSAETRFLLASHTNPAEAITRLNRHILDLNVSMFVTMLCLVLEPETGRVEIVNAGHMLPMWVQANGSILEPGDETVGLPIGVLPDFEYELSSIVMAKQQRLVLYTDGINEAQSPAGELFGLKRLREVVIANNTNLADSGDAIIKNVLDFVDTAEQSDDMCVVAVSRD